MLNFNLNKVNFSEKLNSGPSWAIYPYQKDLNDKQWVAKHIVTSKIENMLKQMSKITLNFSLDHPNILPVRGYNISFDETQKNWNIYTKMPRMQESLKDKMVSYIHKKKAFSKDDLVKYFYALTSGLKYLHDRKIPHGDFRPENILFGPEGQVKISVSDSIGEGSDVIVEQAEKTFYSAPEVLNPSVELKKKNFIKADAWSLGIVLAEMCLIKSKFGNMSLLADKNDAEISLALRDVEEKYSKDLIELIKELLRSDPAQRKSVYDIHKILKEKYKRILGFEEEVVRKGIVQRVIVEERKQGEKVEKVEKVVKPVEDLTIVKDKMDKKWGNVFNIKFEESAKKAVIYPKAFDGMFDGIIQEFLVDLEHYTTAIQSKEFPNFSFSLANCGNVTYKAVEFIGQYIANNATSFQNVSLNFWECRKLTDEAPIALGKSLSQIKDLQTLTLIFDNCPKITDQGIKELIEGLKSNGENLKKLVLKLNGYKQTHPTCITTFTYVISTIFPNLEELLLSLAMTTFGDGSVQGIGNSLILLKKMKILELIFEYNNNLTTETMKNLTAWIANLKQLEKFVLKLRACDGIVKSSSHMWKERFRDPNALEVYFS